ncbi:extracellular solute-binding protein [Streptomyces sp. NPDC048057]|uniref:extracellular solute-binding protein n=1 Tax=Streptomyces sp. NPDC048057 TaxID=3155628 RepID=UPI0033DB4C5C
MQRHLFGLTATLVALSLTTALTGCSSDEPSDVTLQLVAADYDVDGGQSSKDYWNGLVKAFEAENPKIKVDVRIEPWTDVDRTVRELVEAGKAPDMAQVGAYADYAADDKLYAVDDVLSLTTQANFLPPLRDAGEQRRVQYGMPFVASTRLLFYNKKLFEEAGVEQPPRTWDELRDAAKRLKDGTDVKYPYALPLGPEEAQAETMLWMLGGDDGGSGYTQTGGTYAINSEAHVETFSWLKSNLVEPGLTGPVAPGKLNRKDAFAAFARGEVGMLNGHPSLLKTAEAAGIDLGMVAVPGRKGKPKTTMGVADWIMGFKENGNRAEIRTFLDFVFNDANVLAFAGQNNLLPVTNTASHAMAEDAKYDKLKGFLAELPNSVLPPVNKTSWSSVSTTVKQTIGQAVAPEGDPEKVLDAIAHEASKAEAKEEE